MIPRIVKKMNQYNQIIYTLLKVANLLLLKVTKLTINPPSILCECLQKKLNFIVFYQAKSSEQLAIKVYFIQQITGNANTYSKIH